MLSDSFIAEEAGGVLVNEPVKLAFGVDELSGESVGLAGTFEDFAEDVGFIDAGDEEEDLVGLVDERTGEGDAVQGIGTGEDGGGPATHFG